MICGIKSSSFKQLSNSFLKRISLILLVTVLCLCSGCLGRIVDPNALIRIDRPDLFSVAASSFISVSPDFDWDEIHEIETDSYGRILFIYKMSYNNISGWKERNWMFVCQRSDEKFAYYYSDCFLEINGTEPSEDELSIVKQANDWEKPIADNKLSKTKLTDTYVRYDEVNEPIIMDLFDCENENKEYVFSICEDANGLKLYQYLEIGLDKNINPPYFEIISEYIVIQNTNGEFVYKKITSESDYLSQVSAFKVEQQWDGSGCTIIFRQN